jgi:hypothetical protein
LIRIGTHNSLRVSYKTTIQIAGLEELKVLHLERVISYDSAVGAADVAFIGHEVAILCPAKSSTVPEAVPFPNALAFFPVIWRKAFDVV